jgi:beta-fructofuranosidase
LHIKHSPVKQIDSFPHVASPACADDPDLKQWLKLPGSFLQSPSPDLGLTGWRDPFVLQRPGPDSDWWYVMIGAGVKDSCGTALVYKSRRLTSGELPARKRLALATATA